ncbi:hypothetical protein [Lacticaseibacillus hulanensis]|uniref:AbrB/MazE/SpoVT family DNA-binding domain-containing protein n=1 Tax=Lacticaseibacillus hulanensis TaxID=2493111 RepID=UPI000FDA6958|nr:hypothetical protein [Lacticaseibacillus hulanensis]
MTNNTRPTTIKLPAAVCTQLGIDGKTPMQMVVKNDKLIIQPRRTDRMTNRRLFLVWPLVVALISTIGTYIYWQLQGIHTIPLSGDVSVSSFVIGIGVVTGTLLFAGFFIKTRNDQSGRFSARIYWRNLPAIILSFTIMLGLGLLGIMWLFDVLFPGATFDKFTAALMFLLFTFIADAFMVFAAIAIDATTLMQLWTVVIITGVVIAMATNGTRRWWQHNLSFLGTDMSSNAWRFNFTLIMAAALMITLIDYIFVTLQERHPRSWRLLTMRTILSLIAVDVALVGIFPNNKASHWLHDQAAGMLVILLLILIVGVRWLLPEVSREFLITSYTIAVLLFILNFGFRVLGYPSLTSFEIQAFMLAFGWLLLLFSRLQALMASGTVSWEVVVKAQQ